MLAAALDQAAAKLRAFAAASKAATAQPLKIEVAVAGGGNDKAEADAIKRGQRPELIAALRKAL